ncbi:MAG: ATP synthase F1 subunit epsilon [Blautia sp.]|nr:ATP synthase F1 subunit epsilon [Blautia sp.]
MNTFPLRIGTPDGLLFEGNVVSVSCRTITGDLAILAGHINYCTALGMGRACVVLEDGTRREAACIGGMLTMVDGECRVLATTWEWKEDIDFERAQSAKKKAEEMISKGGLSDREFTLVEAKLHRALVRIGLSGK